MSTFANAMLVSRLDGQAFYDDELDITWLADANANDQGTWDNQMAWAASFELDGVTGWRLPSMDVNGDGVVVDCGDGQLDAEACKDHELGYMYHWNHITPNLPGSFLNVWPARYWSNIETEQSGQMDYAYAYYYRSAGNVNIIAPKASPSGSAWLVYDGDVGVSVVPVPAAAWLFVSGLTALGWFRRKVR